MPQQSLIKTPPDAGQGLQVNGRVLSTAHEQIVGVLRGRLGQNHGDLLALPKADAAGGIAWSTTLAGAVTPAAQLPEDERLKLQQRAERIVSEIRGLAQQMRSEGPAAQLVAQMLDSAVQTPPGEWLYSVGGKPVLAMWGHAAVGAAVAPPVAAAAATTASIAPVAPAAPGQPPAALPPGSPPPGPGKPWLRWLLWAVLALLMLGLLLWGLQRCSQTPQADAGLAEQIAQAEARNQALEAELAGKRGQAPALQCVPDAPPPAASAPEPEPPASAPLAAASAPEPPPPPPEPKPIDKLKKKIADAGKDCKVLSDMIKREPLLKGAGAEASALKQQIMGTMQQNCRETAIKEAKNLCPGQRPKELAPEMVLVFDASGSMKFSLDVTEQEINQAGAAEAMSNMMRQFGLGIPGGAGGAVLERLTREPRRITVARRAAASVVQRVPSDMNIGLVQVEQCSSARSVGFFSPAQRGSLIGQIQAIEPRAGTPLADGIAKGGAMVDGVKREALMVVVSDGVESCGQDPCAVAAALARSKPYLKINVVDITGTGAGNCVAAATGGKVFTANSPDEVVAMTNRAAQDAMGPAHCKP